MDIYVHAGFLWFSGRGFVLNAAAFAADMSFSTFSTAKGGAVQCAAYEIKYSFFLRRMKLRTAKADKIFVGKHKFLIAKKTKTVKMLTKNNMKNLVIITNCKSVCIHFCC